MAVPSVPDTPAGSVGVVPAGTVRAGHAARHVPVHLLVVPVPSGPKVYRAMPALLTRTVPKFEVCAVFTVAFVAPVVAEEAAAPEFPAVVDVEAFGVDDPQAARTKAATARP